MHGGGKVGHCQEETDLRAIFRVMRCAGAGDKFRTHLLAPEDVKFKYLQVAA